ncbi:MAG: repressor LexA [Clostridia bacterium]|nr:repressor LexA [Clostridia bacterium]
MRTKSTERMDEIMRFVDAYHLKHHHSPSTSEIAQALGIVKSTVYKYLVEMNVRGILSYDGKDIVTEVTQKDKADTIQAAILGSVSCGLPQYAEENIEEYVSLPVSLFGTGEFFILRANGESMIEAGIEDGDLVVIRKQEHANEGDIIVALVENETTLKRYYLDKKGQKVRLHPENKTMEDIFVRTCRIQGVAVNVVKSLIN